MIVASFVVKNEAARYLDLSLNGAKQLFDEIFVFDDNSTDSTVDVAKCYTDHVYVNDDVSFMEHEGQFRQNAWYKCINELELTEDDWIFVIDADEIFGLEGRKYDSYSKEVIIAMLKQEIDNYVSTDKDCWRIHIPDIQNLVDMNMYCRTDGFWNENYAPRLGRAKKLPFYNKKMGSFSIPQQYVMNATVRFTPLKLLHFGYLDPVDMHARYQRYSSLKNHGHNDKHIESIIKTPNLKKWDGVVL